MDNGSTLSRRSRKIGLTGGVASGKSLAAKCFVELGRTVIDADSIARELLAPGAALLDPLQAEFGEGLVAADGVLDRAKLRKIIFASAAKRRRLEQLLHPPILDAMTAASEKSGGPYVVLMIPLLIEANAMDRVDRVLLIDCPETLQLERLMLRDGIDRTLAERMLSAQATREQRLANADEVIENIGSKDELADCVARVDDFYRKLAA